MGRKPNIHVSDYGAVYSLTPSNWRKFVEEKMSNNNPDIRKYGKYKCYIDHSNIDDIDEDEAQYILEQLNK